MLNPPFEDPETFSGKVKKIIPAGSHTYSKGDDQFPYNAPKFVYRGKGSHVWDTEEREFIDWGMGLRNVILGHCYDSVTNAIIEELKRGSNFTRPSPIEYELAELMLKTIPGYDMVKFGKNGSDATTAAVKLARAFTKKDVVLRCNQPFFSIGDWFIGTTDTNAGVPQAVRNLTKTFNYNDIESLKTAFEENKGNVACVIMEAVRDIEPAPGFLEDIKRLCKDNNAVFIIDEIISGFRYNIKGAQSMFNITADLTTFGKAMANGFSVSALMGKREIMELGGLEHNKEKVFLMSQTHGGETPAIAAAIKTIEELHDKDALKHVWKIGKLLVDSINKVSKEHALEKNIFCTGYPCSPNLVVNIDNKNSYELRTLFMEKMTENDNILFPWIAPSYSHTEEDVQRTVDACSTAMVFCKKALDEGTLMNSIKGSIIKPVFRRFN